MATEETPLLWPSSALQDPHQQFCMLAGVPPSNAKFDKKKPFVIGAKTLYGRTTNAYASARRSYNFMSGLNNTLLLSQVILGATLTALGASESSHILITCFGVLNTVIAGLVAYMKSRGQPARARLYRDDLEMVLNQIEDSEIMWLGISEGIHGYDEIDIDDKVTVRSEVARLMRLYDKARKSFILSNPDNYLMGQSDTAGTALRSRAGVGGGFPPAPPVTLPAVVPAPPAPVAGPSTAPPATAPAPPPVEVQDPDESPASAPTKAVKDSTPPSPDIKDTVPEQDKPVPSNGASDSSNKLQDPPKDDPPSYNNSPNASKDDLKPAPTNEAKPPPPPEPAKDTPQPSTPAATPQTEQPPAPPAPAAEADPDDSPATSARGFTRTKSNDGKKLGKGKGKDTDGTS